MTEMLRRAVGWIVRELDGCREHSSVHSLYLADSDRAVRYWKLQKTFVGGTYGTERDGGGKCPQNGSLHASD